MKFKCGPSLAERYSRHYERQRNWHSWWAWHPMRIEGVGFCVWLEQVERKNTGPACHDGWDEWEYRLPGVSP